LKLLLDENLPHVSLLTVPPLREHYQNPLFRLGLHFLLIGSFVLGDHQPDSACQ
jgi:hypothetical protein